MRRPVAVLGATGMVGRRMAGLLADHPEFELALIVGSPDSEGASFESLWKAKEDAVREHYGPFWTPEPFPEGLRGRRVSRFEDILRSEIEVVFSSVPERAGPLEAKLVESGRTVFSNSPYARFDEGVPVIVPEANAGVLAPRHRLVKNPNCVTSGLVILLTPILQRYGLASVSVTTYQSLSGRGDALYDSSLVVHNVYSLHGSEERTEHYIRGEVKKVLGTSAPISVACYRVDTQEGHLVDVRVRTVDPIGSRDDVVRLFEEFSPLASLGLHSAPRSPIVVLQEPGRPRPRDDAWHERGMAVAVGNLSTDDEVHDLRLTYVVNNLVRGAAGGALLNAELWQHRRSAR
ncbi:MAG TPA: aspartate-semialdehyde dehydrogenase [Labilithrix sp.]|nr:aspartate-semialdehyde dehydrogenase [Labilithrix sp.]